MSSFVLSNNFLNRLKSRFLDCRYQLLDNSENNVDSYSLYSSEDSRRTSYASDIAASEQHQHTNELYDTLKEEKQNPYNVTKRIISQNCPEKFEIFYEVHRGFTSEQTSLIENALQIVADRLFKPEILQNMYQICGKTGCFLAHGVLTQSNLIQNSIYFNKYLLLHYQLMCLKSQSQNGEISTINIYPVHGNSQNQDNSSVASLFCIAHGSTFLIDCEFDIQLDQDKLDGSVKNSANALFWAGEIVYKILQNLGHRLNETCHTNRSQIKIFKQCFLYDGNYIPHKTE